MYQKGDIGTGERSLIGGGLAYCAVDPELDPQYVYKPGVGAHLLSHNHSRDGGRRLRSSRLFLIT